jgi:hypothetical protein
MPHVEQFELRHNKHSTGSQDSRAALDQQLIVDYTAGQVPDMDDI